MEIKPIEVFSEASHQGIVRMPGRHYPGCVIQGDSLSTLVGLVKHIALCFRDGCTDKEELPYELEELQEALLERLLHYQEVLKQEGIGLPYSPSVSRSDFVKLTTSRGKGP